MFLFTSGLPLLPFKNISLAHNCPDSMQSYNLEENRGPFQYPIRRLIVRSCKVSKPWDLYLELYDRSEIWQAPRERCCRRACQISKRCDNLNYWSRGIETSRDLTIRRVLGYWNGARVFREPSKLCWPQQNKDVQNRATISWVYI